MKTRTVDITSTKPQIFTLFATVFLFLNELIDLLPIIFHLLLIVHVRTPHTLSLTTPPLLTRLWTFLFCPFLN